MPQFRKKTVFGLFYSWQSYHVHWSCDICNKATERSGMEIRSTKWEKAASVLKICQDFCTENICMYLNSNVQEYHLLIR